MHEQVGHLIVGRGKALQMPRRFEPTHDLPSDPGRLESMRICEVWASEAIPALRNAFRSLCFQPTAGCHPTTPPHALDQRPRTSAAVGSSERPAALGEPSPLM